MDGQTNIKLIVVFRNFANAPKKHLTSKKGGCLLNYPNMQANGSDCVCVRARAHASYHTLFKIVAQLRSQQHVI